MAVSQFHRIGADFRTGDGTRIDPLTVTDAASRYLLRCQIVERTDFVHAQAVFEAAFREFGLPDVIHTDNGVPFASVAPGGMGDLSMVLCGWAFYRNAAALALTGQRASRTHAPHAQTGHSGATATDSAAAAESL